MTFKKAEMEKSLGMGYIWVKWIPSTTNDWILRFNWDLYCTSFKKNPVTVSKSWNEFIRSSFFPKYVPTFFAFCWEMKKKMVGSYFKRSYNCTIVQLLSSWNSIGLSSREYGLSLNVQWRNHMISYFTCPLRLSESGQLTIHLCNTNCHIKFTQRELCTKLFSFL